MCVDCMLIVSCWLHMLFVCPAGCMLTECSLPPLCRCAPLQHQAFRARQGSQVREGPWPQKEPWIQGLSGLMALSTGCSRCWLVFILM